jgi:hypothetical protein
MGLSRAIELTQAECLSILPEYIEIRNLCTSGSKAMRLYIGALATTSTSSRINHG